MIFIPCQHGISCFCSVWFFSTPWTVARQTPLSMGFSRQEYWSGLPRHPPGDHPDPGIEPASLMSLHWQAGSLSPAPPGKPTSESVSHPVMSNSLWPMWLCSSWYFSQKNIGVGIHSLFQGIFLTQWSDPGLLHCRQILDHLSHHGSLIKNIKIFYW